MKLNTVPENTLGWPGLGHVLVPEPVIIPMMTWGVMVAPSWLMAAPI